MAVEKGFRQTNSVSYSKKNDTVLFHYLTSERIIHYVSDISLC